MTIERIDIHIRSDGTREVKIELSNIANAADKAHRSINILKSALGLIGGYLSVTKILQWSDAWNEATGKIRIFTKSQEELTAVQNKLFESAQRTRQEFLGTADLYSKVAVHAKALNMSQNEMIKFTEIVNKHLSLMHVPATTAKGVLLQLGQSLGTVNVKAQDFNSVLSALPSLVQLVATKIDRMGGSVAKLKQEQNATHLSSIEWAKGISATQKETDEMFEKSAKTFQQSFTIIDNEFDRYTGRLNEANNVSDKFYKFASKLQGQLPELVSRLLAVGAAIATAFLLSRVTAFTSAIAGLFVLINAHPFVALASAIAGAITYITLMGDDILIGSDKITTYYDLMLALGDDVADIWKFIGSVFSNVMGSIETDLQEIDSVFGISTSSWWADVKAFFTHNETGLAGFLISWGRANDFIAVGVRTTFDFVAEYVGNIFANLTRTFENAIIKVKNGMIELDNFGSKHIPGFEQPLQEKIPYVQKSEIPKPASFQDEYNKQAATQEAFGSTAAVKKLLNDAKITAQKQIAKDLVDANNRIALSNLTGGVNLDSKSGGNQPILSDSKELAKAAKAAAKEKNDIEKSIIKDNKEFESSFDAMVKKIAPATNGIKEYNDALELIDRAESKGMFNKQSTSVKNFTTDLDRAYQAILKIESAGGKAAQVNKSSHALGQMQVLPSTLRDPGYGVKPFQPAIDQNITKGMSYERLVKFVQENEAGLKKFGEDYFKGLVRHHGSIIKAVNAYGEHTAAYMAKFKKYYSEEGNGNKGLTTKVELLKQVKLHYEPIIEPLTKINEKFKEEQKLLELTSDEREIANKFLALNNELKSKDIELSDEQAAGYIKTISAIQELNKETAIRDSLLANSPQQQLKDFARTSKVIDQTFPVDKEGNRPSGFSTSIAGQVSSLGLDPNKGVLGEDTRIINEQLIKDKITEIRKEFSDDTVKGAQVEADLLAQIEFNKNQAILGQAENFFNTLTPLMQSKNRGLAIAGKAAAIASATISGIAGAMKAYEQMGVYGAAGAAAIGIVTAVNVAKIAATPVGFMTGGSFVVGGTGGPDTQNVAFRATPGERITISTPTQVRKGDETNTSGSNSQQKPSIVKVANYFDKNLMRDFIETKEGEEVFMNFITRNSTGINNALRT